MLTGILLVTLGVGFRLLSPEFHIWNFVPAGAIALYAGARLPRKWAWTVPLAAMVLSDLYLEYGSQRPVFELTRWTVYGTLAATTLLGPIARGSRMRSFMAPGLSIVASLVFYVTTNFSTWAEGLLYPMTWSGLATCYVMAIPFLWNSLAADLLGTCALFGLGPFVERSFTRLTGLGSVETAGKPDTAELSEAA